MVGRKERKRKVDAEEEKEEKKSKIEVQLGHFEVEIDEKPFSDVSRRITTRLTSLRHLGDVSYSKDPTTSEEFVAEAAEIGKLQVKKSLASNWHLIAKDKSENLSNFQAELFGVIGGFRDLYFSHQTAKNADEIRSIYVLHALDHVLKSRTKILQHNAALKRKAEKGSAEGEATTGKNGKTLPTDDEDDEFRDQGFTRPRVLILTPFRHGALRIVETMSTLLFGAKDKGLVKNKKRFMEEYGRVEDEDKSDKPRFPRPVDYRELFVGNVDDCFRIGLSVAKKSLKLYVKFYMSDIIVASPLGIRSASGAEGDTDFDADFLSSIELLVLDQSDVFLMQNWSHVVHIIENINKRPKDSHGADFSRIRHWALNDLAPLYRQTMLFSALDVPEMRNVFSKFCRNYAGFVRATQMGQAGALGEIYVDVPQAFYRFPCDEAQNDADRRFDFFRSNLLPQYKTSMRRTLIFVPSYFDFVRLRNFMKKDECSFVQCCEYSEDAKLSRARDLFYHEKKQFLLLTERFHFYKRYSIRGVRHLIFYQLPVYPKFYADVCNMLEDQREVGGFTCSVLYSKYDALRLAAVVGAAKARVLLGSEKSIHMVVSNE